MRTRRPISRRAPGTQFQPSPKRPPRLQEQPLCLKCAGPAQGAADATTVGRAERTEPGAQSEADLGEPIVGYNAVDLRRQDHRRAARAGARAAGKGPVKPREVTPLTGLCRAG